MRLVSAIALMVGVTFATAQGSPCIFMVNGVIYNLSPLAGIVITLPDATLSAVFSYQLVFCKDLPQPCVEVSGVNSTGNLYMIATPPKIQCFHKLSNWTSPVSATKIPQGISIFWNNGDLCQGAPYVVQMNLKCNPAITGVNGTAFKSPTNPCQYVVSLQTAIVCVGTTTTTVAPMTTPIPVTTPPPGNCTFGGKDLSPLAGQTIYVPDKDPLSWFTYKVAVCSDLVDPCVHMTQTLYGNVYQVSKIDVEVCYDVGMNWVPPEILAGSSGGTLTLTAQNGELCGGVPRKTILVFMCKPGTPVVTGYVETYPCSFVVHMFTDIVC